MKKIVMLVLMIVLAGCCAYAQESSNNNVWEENFPDGLVDAAQNPVGVDALEGKIVGLYFSASWCRGCAAFSRNFVPFRNKHQEKFEVVMVGFDYSTVEMHDYMTKYQMEWTAIPYESPARLAMKERFKVSEIPTLIIMAPNGKVITQDGFQQVDLMGDEAIPHWEKMAAELK
ncbi:MAG: thioredoxin-like domain-containing protein [Candidatus Rifleibacteriota bacterium]